MIGASNRLLQSTLPNFNMEDLPSGPGPQYPANGVYDSATDTGYYGELPTSDLINGANLGNQIGLSAGSSVSINTGWLKFYVGKYAACNYTGLRFGTGRPYVLFIAKTQFRRSVSWSDIYSTGAMFGTGDAGPVNAGTPVTQNTTVTVNNNIYTVRNVTGVGASSEWESLMYKINNSTWDSISAADLGINQGNGSGTVVQETNGSTSYPLRGFTNITFTATVFGLGTRPLQAGWRPALQLRSFE